MEKHTQNQEVQNLSEKSPEDFEIFVLEKIDRPTLQHDQ